MLRKLLLVVVIVCECLSDETPSVVTKSGKILGHYLTSFGNNKYEAYQGIPYALPPTGERRFKSPVPIPPWSGKLVANRLEKSCWQLKRHLSPSGSLIVGDEDCLYLNVFVPERKANKTSPVLFWIHGGGFLYGANKPEEESFMMNYEVILVTVQYRLGALGFLSTEDGVVSGNMGLKDQSLALRWVHENIEYFGGDPNKITLYGQSAGGASVHYHYLSPMSAGLFRNGISMSGTAFNWWAQTEYSRQKALEFGRLMNCTTRNTEEMVECLRKCPASDLVNTQLKFMPWRLHPSVPFGPVAEKLSDNPFIDRLPREILESGQAYDVPWINGVVSEEGLFPTTEYLEDVTAFKDINDNWNEIAPLLLGYNDTIPKENHTSIARTIRKHYFGEKPINKDTFMTLVYLVTDRWFVADAENAAKYQAKANKSPVLFYRYIYRANTSMTFKLLGSSKYYGVCHGDEVNLFMKNKVMSPTKSPSDMLMMKQWIRTLASFASDGSPNLGVQWSKVDPTKNLNYLEVSGPKSATMKTTDNLGQKKFWNSLGFNENKPTSENLFVK